MRIVKNRVYNLFLSFRPRYTDTKDDFNILQYAGCFSIIDLTDWTFEPHLLLYIFIDRKIS